MSRQRYVKYRLKILRELCIDQPSQDKIEKMMNPKAMTDAEVDTVFRGCIDRAYF